MKNPFFDSSFDSRKTMRRGSRQKLLAAAIAGALTAICAPSALRAQTPARPAQGATGLDALDDGKLMADLANRSLDKLLQRYFDEKNVPQDKRQEILSLESLRILNQPAFQSLPAAERSKRLSDIAGGIQKILPTMHDPTVLMEDASGLVINGTGNLEKIIELFGENPSTQAELRPLAQAVVDLLGRADSEAHQQADTLINQITTAEDPRMAKWTKLDQLDRLARYNEAFAIYDLAISIDKSDPKRKEVCDQAEDILKDFDTPDSGVQEEVKLRLGKIQLAEAGTVGADPDASSTSRTDLQWVLNAPAPKPDASTDAARLKAELAAHLQDQDEARYSLILLDLVDKKPDDAQKDLATFEDWEQQNLPTTDLTKKQRQAQNAMLQFRIYSTEAEMAPDNSEARKTTNAKAVQVLMDLLHDRPDLKGIVFQQVLTRLPDKPDMKHLDPLLLDALISRGVAEALKKGDDVSILDLRRGIAAAAELASRKDQPGVTALDQATVALRRAVMLQKLGQVAPSDERVADLQGAASAFLDVFDQHAAQKQMREYALDYAIGAVGTLKSNPDAKDDTTNALYERVLKDAYLDGRNQFAYEYAVQQQDEGNFRDAITAFGKVPDDAARPIVQIMARYFEMYSTEQLLSQGEKDQATGKMKPINDYERKKLAGRVQDLANQVNQLVDKAMPSADEKLKSQLRVTKVRTTLIAADLASNAKDYKRVLDLLNGFEDSVKGLDNAPALIGQALFLRFNAQMEAGQTQAAFVTLQDFLKGASGETAMNSIRTLLGQIDASYQAAQGRNDHDAMVQLATERATLADLLVQEADKNPKDPNGPAYRAYRAEVTRQAAAVETDPAKRAKLLADAMTAYQEILKDKPNDPAIMRYIGFIDFDLGKFADSQKILGQLFAQRRFGGPTVESTDPATGELKVRPNDMYWEAMYKLMRSDLELAKSDPSKAGLKNDVTDALKGLYITNGSSTGGIAWKTQFADLRQELLPDWHGDQNEAASTAPSPSTTPSPSPAAILPQPATSR